jgi:Fe-S-cluster-containing dehydrogenase component
VRACADAHEGVTRLVRDGLRYDKFLVATSCRSCRDPLCMVGCPVGSIRRHPDSLEIIIEDWCIGCGLCGTQCPYGNINLHPFKVVAEDPDHPGVMKAVVREKATTCDLSREYHGLRVRLPPRRAQAHRAGEVLRDHPDRHLRC